MEIDERTKAGIEAGIKLDFLALGDRVISVSSWKETATYANVVRLLYVTEGIFIQIKEFKKNRLKRNIF